MATILLQIFLVGVVVMVAGAMVMEALQARGVADRQGVAPMAPRYEPRLAARRPVNPWVTSRKRAA